MANLKGTIEFPQGGSSYKTIRGKIDWEETQIDSTSSPARSKVHTKLYAKTGTGSTTGKQWSGYVQVGSNSKHSFSSISSSTTISSTYVLLQEYDDWVTHNDDGSKTVTISGKVQGPSGTSIANVSSTGSGTVTLTNVPQASTITSVTSGTTDYAPSVVWTPASTSFKYKLVFSYGNWSAATGILSPDTTSAYTYNGYTITGANVASYMEGASGTFTVTLYTYASDGTTQIGNTSSKTFTVTLNASYKPTASISTFTDVGGLVPSNWGIFVQSKSKLSFTVSATPSAGSTISSYSTTINGSTYNTTSITTGFLTGNGSANLTVTDSRDRTDTASRSYIVYPYSKPSITNTTADRCLQDGTLSDSGTYLKYSFASTISSCNGNNTATYELGYRVKGSNSAYTYVTISNNATDVVLSGVTFNSNSSYDLQFRVTDAFNEVVWENESIGTGFKLVHYNKNKKAMAIGKTSEAGPNEELFEIGMDTEINGKIRRVKSIELFNSTPYIDFHYGNSSTDFTSRIISNANGYLSQLDQPTGHNITSGYNNGIWELTTTTNGIKIDGVNDNFGTKWLPGRAVSTDTWVSMGDIITIPKDGLYLFVGYVDINFYGADGRELKFALTHNWDYNFTFAGGIINTYAWSMQFGICGIDRLNAGDIVHSVVTNSDDTKNWAFNGASIQYIRLSP